MRVRFLLDAAVLNPKTQRYRKLHAGKSYDLPDDVAVRFMERGAAVEVDPADEPEPQDDSNTED